MLRRTCLLLPFLLLTACGDFVNPFAGKKPFVPTAVPDDFVIIVDENHDTFVNRQHIQQVITAKDSMSRTTYTNYRDYNDTVADSFTQTTPLNASQVQEMWNTVCRENVMEGSAFWINWLSDTDLHQRNSYIIQVRASERARTYRQTNGFSGRVRPLMLLISAVRLPITQNANVPVVGGAATVPPATSTAPAPQP